MGKRGPAKLPSNIIQLRGNPGKRPINKQEPQFEGEACPTEDILKDEIALAEWNRRAPELIELGLLTGQFQTEFADYCFQHALHIRLWRKIQENGEELAIAKGYMKAFQSASQQRLRLAAKFGFDPSDSSGIKIKPKDKQEGAKRFLA